jgi:Mor family transcriptional regulator
MSKITKQELIKLQKSLVTDEAIGEKFGITRQAVHQMRKKFGIESRYIKNPKRNAGIVAAYKKGISAADLAKKFEQSISQTYRILNAAGVKKKQAGKKK